MIVKSRSVRFWRDLTQSEVLSSGQINICMNAGICSHRSANVTSGTNASIIEPSSVFYEFSRPMIEILSVNT